MGVVGWWGEVEGGAGRWVGRGTGRVGGGAAAVRLWMWGSSSACDARLAQVVPFAATVDT